MKALFGRKSPMDKLEAELASLRSRAETLKSRKAAADAAFSDAKSKLQAHHLEGDLDADDKVRAKLETALATSAFTRDGYADALSQVQTKIAEVAQRFAAEHAAAERKSASEKLARDLDVIEQMLTKYLEAARGLAKSLEPLHFHFEMTQLMTFVGNVSSQIEIAASLAMEELRSMVGSIHDGAAPIPGAKPAPAAEADPPHDRVHAAQRKVSRP